MGGCADGETEVTKNTNSHDKKKDQNCNGGLQSYCCKGFKPPPTKAELKKKAEDDAKAAAEAAAANAVLDVAAQAFCRVAIPALLAPLEALEALIPIIGKPATHKVPHSSNSLQSTRRDCGRRRDRGNSRIDPIMHQGSRERGQSRVQNLWQKALCRHQ